MPFLSFILLFAICLQAQDWSLDRPYTLRTLDYLPMLRNLHNQTQGGELSGIFPRRDSLWRHDLPKNPMLSWKGSNAYLAASPVGGIEYRGFRSLDDTVKSLDGGLYLRGYKDSVEFWLDARIFNESHSISNVTQNNSWDREFLEVQNDENGDANYTSYARYRGHMSLHMGWARLDVGRDAAHWGPGYFDNLTLNQQAVPFTQMSLETRIGPLTVKSLYGDLNISKSSMSSINKRSKSLYAHRYELQATQNLILAVNELTILDSINKPILFVPIVPLFMQKGQMSEDNNNGALSADFCYRMPGWFRIYSEFFLDDMASPVSLVKNDNIEAKWAHMAGLHLIRNFRAWEFGSLFEYARVEPYVYTHFSGSYAQISNQGYPLGNQLGPNSLSFDAMAYARHENRYFGSLRARLWWKGTDYGSAVTDTTPSSKHYSTPKTFLTGASRKFTLSPSFAYTGQYVGLQLEISLFDNPGVYTRLGFQW
ncbi:MAG TPA: capsule assembly Wzi family protein [Fibrobacteraceae bacterium]|nr:capsule assembly Wzi family protein [Fibrobacteraceae bacterium]